MILRKMLIWQSEITVVPHYHGFLLAILPPGAFIVLGMLIAGKNWLNLRAEQKLRGGSASITQADAVRVPA